MLVKSNVTHCGPASSWKDDLGQSQKSSYLLNRCIWTACASTSILASRDLLVNSNLHYPAHIFFLQVVAGIGFSYLYSWCIAARAGPEEVRSFQGCDLLLGFTCLLMASSAAIFPHAILQLPNISMLAMVSILSPITKSILMSIGGETNNDRTEIFRLAGASLGCIGILYGDYRFVPTGIVLSLISAILVGVSGWITTLASYKSSERHTQTRCNLPIYLYYSFGLAVIGIAWKESTQDFLHAMHWKHVPLLCCSILSTALSMSQSETSLANMLPPAFAPEIAITRYTTRSYDILASLALSGVTGIASTTGSHRSFTTPIQLGSLFTTTICLCKTPRFTHIWEHWSDEEAEYRLPLAPSTQRDSAHDVPRRVLSQTYSEELGSLRLYGNRRLLLLVFGGFLSSVWIVFVVLNFGTIETLPVFEDQIFLDRGYSPSVSTEIVISMYKEPIANVASLISTLRAMPAFQSPVFHIYLEDNSANSTKIRRETNAEKLKKLPNVGREGETYLKHILDYYDALAKHTLFVQADVHNRREFFGRIEDYFNSSRTGMLNLGPPGTMCNCNNCGDRFGWADSSGLLPSLHEQIHNSTLCENIHLSYKGQFIVSAKRIRGVRRGVYHGLRDALVDPTSWAHREDFLHGRRDSMNAPSLGYTLERLWNMLFQCAGPEIGWRCPSLLSKWRAGGDIRDCQCFDE